MSGTNLTLGQMFAQTFASEISLKRLPQGKKPNLVPVKRRPERDNMHWIQEGGQSIARTTHADKNKFSVHKLCVDEPSQLHVDHIVSCQIFYDEILPEINTLLTSDRKVAEDFFTHCPELECWFVLEGSQYYVTRYALLCIYNNLNNLQALNAMVNMKKSNADFMTWFTSNYPCQYKIFCEYLVEKRMAVVFGITAYFVMPKENADKLKVLGRFNLHLGENISPISPTVEAAFNAKLPNVANASLEFHALLIKYRESLNEMMSEFVGQGEDSSDASKHYARVLINTQNVFSEELSRANANLSERDEYHTSDEEGYAQVQFAAWQDVSQNKQIIVDIANAIRIKLNNKDAKEQFFKFTKENKLETWDNYYLKLLLSSVKNFDARGGLRFSEWFGLEVGIIEAKMREEQEQKRQRLLSTDSDGQAVFYDYNQDGDATQPASLASASLTMEPFSQPNPDVTSDLDNVTKKTCNSRPGL